MNRALVKKLFYQFQSVVSTLIYPYFKFRQQRLRNQARILEYHNVSEFPSENQVPYDNVSPSLFKQHMSILAEENYNVVTVGKMVELLHLGDIPPKTICITFDDGYKNNYFNALPILLEKRLDATFFVITGAIGDKKPFKHMLWDSQARSYFSKHPESRLPMNAKELIEIASAGMEIGAHGVSHRSIGNLEPAEVWHEALTSKTVLEKLLKAPVGMFSYPFGSRAYNDFNEATASALEEVGYSAACITDIGTVGIDTNVYELPRIPIHEKDSRLLFRQKIAGAYDWVNLFKDIFQRHAQRIDNIM